MDDAQIDLRKRNAALRAEIELASRTHEAEQEKLKAAMHLQRNSYAVELPWQTRAVLAGPWASGVIRVRWWDKRRMRKQRPVRKSRMAAAHEATCISSVPVPCKRLAGLCAALCTQLASALLVSQTWLDWQQLHPTRAGGWHFARLLPGRDSAARMPIEKQLNAYAQQRIVQLRTDSYRQGGWWPAPVALWIGVHGETQAIGIRLRFVPGFIANKQTKLVWPRAAISMRAA